MTMPPPNRPIKWTQIDEEIGKSLLSTTGAPGGVFQLSLADLPKNLQAIPGLSSFFVSAYIDPKTIAPNKHLVGEIAIGRDEGEISKYYTYVFAVSEEGIVSYTGPTKDFPLHHTRRRAFVPAEELFGHHPLAPHDKR